MQYIVAKRMINVTTYICAEYVSLKELVLPKWFRDLYLKIGPFLAYILYFRLSNTFY